jgi:hypothetical protein
MLVRAGWVGVLGVSAARFASAAVEVVVEVAVVVESSALLKRCISSTRTPEQHSIQQKYAYVYGAVSRVFGPGAVAPASRRITYFFDFFSSGASSAPSRSRPIFASSTCMRATSASRRFSSAMCSIACCISFSLVAVSSCSLAFKATS